MAELMGSGIDALKPPMVLHNRDTVNTAHTGHPSVACERKRNGEAVKMPNKNHQVLHDIV